MIGRFEQLRFCNVHNSHVPDVLERMQLYEGARNAIHALERRCAASEGPYLLGKRPCSLDAKAYGVLAYLVAAHNVAPALKDAMQHATALQRCGLR